MQCLTEPIVRTLSYPAPTMFDPKIRLLPSKQSIFYATQRRAGGILAGAALLLAAAGAQAQFGSQPVGATTGNQGVTVTASVSGTVSSVEILTLGSPSGDFAAGTGTSNCASATLTESATCTESIQL